MLDIAFMLQLLPTMLRAAAVTVEISVLTLLFALPLAAVGALVQILGPRPVALAIRGFVVFTRGVPPLVQISAVYFLPPRAGLMIDEFWTGVIALTLIGTGYSIEIIRAAVQSIDRGQRESALALGFTEVQVLVLVLAPQALRRMLPPLANEVANLVKASALLSVISVNEITKVANDTIFETFVVVEVLIEMAVLYIAIVGTLMWMARRLEERAKG
jgi:His/Glu/Gln/Arg/opine family amino acid ABC transporter permease subunit